MNAVITTASEVGLPASVVGAVIWGLSTDVVTRLCAGMVAVFHDNSTRRRDARAVLTATKRPGLRR